MSTILLNSLNVTKSTLNSTASQISGYTTLNGSIDASTNSIAVTSTTQFVANGTVKIDNEYITYASISGSTLTGCVRGAFGSTATSHTNTTTVYGAFVGTSELNPQPNVACSMSVDCSGLLYFQYSNDGTTWGQFPSNGYNVSANIGEFQSALKLLRYFRVIFVNISTTKTNTLILATYYGNFGQPLLSLNQSISDDYTCSLTRSVLTGQDPNGSFTNGKNSGYVFQTTSTLTANNSYTSAVYSTSGYTQIQTELYSDVSGVLTGYWYTDPSGTHLIRTFVRPYDSSTDYSYFSSPIFGPYVKYVYTNGNANQSAFYLGFKFLTESVSGQIVNLNDFISENMVANLGRNVIVGETDGGQFLNVPITNEGHLEVAVHDPINPFYSLHTESLTPLVQSQFVYQYSANGLPNPNVFTSFGLSNGSVDISNNMINARTTTTTGSFVQIIDKRVASYSPGQGLIARFTGKYTAGESNTTQFVGISNGQDELGFGYNDTVFGIFYKSFGVLPAFALTVTTATGTSISTTIVLNGISYPISITLGTSGSTTETAYKISALSYAGWNTNVNGSTVYFQYNLPITNATLSATNTPSVITFGAPTTLVAGVEPASTFIPQSSWNGDPCNGTGKSGFNLNPIYGNIFEIGVQYLGFGTISFAVEATFSGNNSNMIKVHTLKTPNTLTKPTLSVPSFNFKCSSLNNASSQIVTSSGSYGIFSEGIKKFFGNRFTHSRTLTTVSTTVVPVYSIENALVFNGKLNKKAIVCTNLQYCIRITGSSTGTLFIYKNVTLGTGTNFTPYNSVNSIAYVDTASTSVVATNDKMIASYILPDAGNVSVELDDVVIYPGEILTFAGQTSAGTAATFAFSVNTREDD